MNIAPYILSKGNWISVEEFMEIALYDEKNGYYSNHISDIGYRGDFSTSATMSDLLARRLVAQWKESCKIHNCNLPIIEIGGGNGDMAVAIHRQMGLWDKIRSHYCMVDRSMALRNLQKMVAGTSVRMFADMSKALRHTGGKAFIFSNELPDAFPVRQFVYQDGQWLELGYSVAGGKVVRAVKEKPLPGNASALKTWCREGQVIEVNEQYTKWYADWINDWKFGTFVTIDYGELNDTLYHRRPDGTLRGYKAHTLLNADELPNFTGHSDITADVNFTDLRQLAEGCQGDIVHYMSQRDYLLPYVEAGNKADEHLVAVPGAGDHFNVLIQHRVLQ